MERIAIVILMLTATRNGWDGTDRMDVTLNNGSKWVGAAMSVHMTDTGTDADGDGVF